MTHATKHSMVSINPYNSRGFVQLRPSTAPPIQKLNWGRRLADIPRKVVSPPQAMVPEMIGDPAEQKGNPLSDTVYSFVYRIFPTSALLVRMEGASPPLHFKDCWNALPILRNDETLSWAPGSKHIRSQGVPSASYIMDPHTNDVICVTYMRDASGKYAPQDFNFYNQFPGDVSHRDHQKSTTSSTLDWDDLQPKLELDFEFGMESTPFGHNEMVSSPSQQALLSATQSLPAPITPTTDEMSSSITSINFADSPGTTPPLSPGSSMFSFHSASSLEEAPFLHSQLSSTSNLSLTASVFPPSAPLPAGLPTLTTAFLPSPISMLPSPTSQCDSPIDDSLDALFAMLCHNNPPSTDCTTAFTQPDQVGLRSLLDSILISPWLITHAPEPKDEKNRSILLGFLVHETTGGTYRCMFDGCHKSLDRQDRALGHIRMHVGHRPFGCNGLCGVPDCQERFYCQSYLRSHAKRQKAPCDICQQFFFRRDLRKHRLCCQGMQNKAQPMLHHSAASAYARSVRTVSNPHGR